jgi:hypothetical protein
MNDNELALIVARIQAGDNRAVDRVTLAHWKETIGHLDFEDAREAVVHHFRESTEYLTAAHVTQLAKIIRAGRTRELTDDERCAKWGPKFDVNGYCALCGIHIEEHVS